MRGRLATVVTTFLVISVGSTAAMAADNGLPPRPKRIPTTPPAATTAAPTCTSTFNAIASAHVGAEDSLEAVSGLSPTDVWAVGGSSPVLGGLFAGSTSPLAEHWNGGQWAVIATPSPGVNTYLLGVAAISPDDVWAVGVSQQTATSTVLPLIEHWDGLTWSVVPAPSVTRGILTAVTAVSSRDVWAVGAWRDDLTSPSLPLAIHWNGAAWSQAAVPALAGGANTLHGVFATSANNVWAVGALRTSGPPALAWQPLVERWNGSAWVMGSAPSSNPSGTNYLAAVGGVSPQDLWAVGWQGDIHTQRTLTFHYTGSPGGTDPWTYYANAVSGSLNAVSAVAADDVWTAGLPVQHWNGSAWSTIADASPAGTALWGTWAAPGDVWAVGDYANTAGAYQSFIENRCVAPAPVSSVAALAGDTEATVTWAKPTSTGASAITSYTVTATPGGQTTTVSPTVPAATITGLSNGTSYTFTVTVFNAAGAGAPSAPSNAVTPRVVARGAVVAVLPAMSNGAYGGYLTTAYLENVTSTPANIRVQYFDQSGQPIGLGNSAAGLPYWGTWTLRQDNADALGAGQPGSAVVYSDQPLAIFVNEFAPGNASDATSYTSVKVPGGAGTKLFAPAIANGAYGGYTTGIGLINTGSAATDVKITYRGTDGTAVKVQTLTAVAAGAYRGVYSGNSGSATDANLPAGFAGTATIESTSTAAQALAAVVNEVGPGGQFSSYDAVPSGQKSLQAPTALNNAFGGFYTGIGIQETSGVAGTVTVTYYNDTGAATPKTFAIAANGYLGLYQGDPQQGPAPGAYTATISSDVPVAAIVNEVAPVGSGSARQSTSYNTFAGGAAAVNLPLVASSGADGWSTGVGIMNTGSSPVTVNIRYFDPATGQQIPSHLPNTSPLAPHAFRGVYTPDDLPAGTRASAVVEASGPIAVICNESSATSFMSYDGQ
jgi:hypothetical protein